MKTAINYLKAELRSLKSCQKSTASTEFKMKYAGEIDELEKAIKHLRQVNQKCEWVDKNTLYKTKCGNITNINPDKFCPFCGREIKEKIMS